MDVESGEALEELFASLLLSGLEFPRLPPRISQCVSPLLPDLVFFFLRSSDFSIGFDW